MRIKQFMACGLAVWLAWAAAEAHADVVVVVGAKSPIGALTQDQVADIYLGRSREYPGGGTAISYIIGASPIKDEFFDKVLHKSDSQARAVWARQTFTGRGVAPRELKDAAEVKQAVSANPQAIGFIDKSALDARVKVVYAP